MLAKEDHDYKSFNLLLDLVFACNLYAAHAPSAQGAVVLYLDAADVLADRDRLSGGALLILLDFLATCSRLLQQQALNDLSLLLEKSQAMRAFFLSTPSWQPRLLRLLQQNCSTSPATTPSRADLSQEAGSHVANKRSQVDHAFRSLPSVVTWGGGMFFSEKTRWPPCSLHELGVAEEDGEGQAHPGPPSGVGVESGGSEAGDEEMGASGLVGLVGKIVSTVAHDMMLVPNGWRVMAHCLDSIRHKRLFDVCAGSHSTRRAVAGSGRDLEVTSDGVQLVRGMVYAACKVETFAVNARYRDVSSYLMPRALLIHLLPCLPPVSICHPSPDGELTGLIYHLQAAKRAVRAADRFDGSVPLSFMSPDVVSNEAGPNGSIPMGLLRDNIGGLLATVYAAEVQNDVYCESEGLMQSSLSAPVWLRWSQIQRSSGTGQSGVLDTISIQELMEVMDLLFEKPGAPLARCTLAAFCSESESWTHKLPEIFPLVGGSKKPSLSSAMWWVLSVLPVAPPRQAPHS